MLEKDAFNQYAFKDQFLQCFFFIGVCKHVLLHRGFLYLLLPFLTHMHVLLFWVKNSDKNNE